MTFRHLIEWLWSPASRERIAALRDELARERAQHQLDCMHHEEEIARLIRHMARMQLVLCRRDIKPLMLDG